ncbi:GGDEF domain-containing protein [Sinanaerobacter chloroacetimidivorans]|jgi:diguanylate cyclase (GGDEF)-like protein|uniref:GGDEF domain-containing protein n=1 Tax=Sinanaerobacter chloroacetimidivorans TaxID=2818044 RepID=A0A8J7W0R7_9FIRM|nr:GGDEF domain-containing protein [Sinanaerobacter chloroacetimidivorans]MBR0598692.1 GGDEF domain-containing protein [Sinanaerobacter chloroacetimidivorans]
MTDGKKEALDFIIEQKQIRTVFQPIISLRDGSVLGHEALSRITCDCEIKNPDMLFAAASEYNRLWDLELLCRTTALEAAYKFMIPPYSKKLFINVNPNTMHDENFKKGFTKSFLLQYEIVPNNVIFEITERNVITDMTGFRATINHYKGQDYKIAIDDAGAGYSGLNLISDVNPNYIKLDRKLISNIDKDSLKFALVKGMVEFSKVSNISLIAEGIETFEEMETLINLGVQFGQGYFIQEPDAEIHDLSQDVLQTLYKINFKKNHTTQSYISNIYISNLCTYAGTISPNETVPNVYEVFKQNPNCAGLCVVDHDVPVGIINQEKLALKLSGYYGFALHQNKPISHLMDKNFLSVDYKTPVSIVSSAAMARSNDKLYDFIVITEKDHYMGVVTIKDLLQKTTEIEISAAKHQNPLSGLPGNLIIEQKLNQCLNCSSKYSVAYLDIDNFKAYNDVYGFEKGDLIIKLLADILRSSLNTEQFVGHVGGDDFVVVLNDHVNEDFFKDMILKFENEVLNYYNQTDRENGFISTTNRRNEIEQFPLISLTIVVVSNQTQMFRNVFELTEMLAGLKKIAKTKHYPTEKKEQNKL